MIREPQVAGQFYPAKKKELVETISRILPGCAEKITARGVVAPHAGYMYSGSVAGEVYAKIKPKATYIILGPNHTELGASFSAFSGSWKTPLDIIHADTVLLETIMNNTDLIVEDVSAHMSEHSIEVQLPFIQTISPAAKIVPIMVRHSSLEDLREVASAITEALRETKKDAIIVASSDMSHYETRQVAEKKDKKAIERIIQLDPEGLLDVVEREDISMCGVIPTAIMLFCAKEMNASKAKLIRYTDSGEVTGDTVQVVGYAGIIVM
ncbi:MAG: AmmeMemoRadiSam system protein B [Candidatus Omnitrophota bacterium]